MLEVEIKFLDTLDDHGFPFLHLYMFAGQHRRNLVYIDAYAKRSSPHALTGVGTTTTKTERDRLRANPEMEGLPDTEDEEDMASDADNM